MNYLNFLKPDTKGILEQVKASNPFFLKRLYQQYRVKFILWFKRKYNIEEEEAVEMYQKAFTIFYFNVKDGKVKEINGEISTYLIGVGKNLLKEAVRNKKRTVPLDDLTEHAFVDLEDINQYEISHQKFIVQRALQKVGEPCKSLLTLYYFQNYSYEAIANNLGYKDDLGVKKKKCLCLRKIREQISKEKNQV